MDFNRGVQVKPCRACRKKPLKTIDRIKRSATIKCPHCGFECEAYDDAPLFEFNCYDVMNRAASKWNEQHGEF